MIKYYQKKLQKKLFILKTIASLVLQAFGKSQLRSSYHDITDFLIDNNIKILPLEFRHLQTLLDLELIHRDPFDRVIIAQAKTDNLTIITMDKLFQSYPVKCLW